MQIVIDIDENCYNDCKTMAILSAEQGQPRLGYIYEKIADGTPLPKGHGRLIDVGQCDRKLFYQQCGGENSIITVKSAFDMLISLPTIIDADKAERED